RENNVEITPTMAGIMLSAILSDTLVYKSPTCTEIDKMAGENLAKIAGIDASQFAMEMFRAGSNLGSKTPVQIIHQDFKKFTVDDETIAIGQINSMSADELKEIKSRVMPELEAQLKADGLDMIFFMLTNILKESSEVIFAGSRAESILENSFNVKANGDSVNLQGVVSRKKQLLPAIVEALQQ
nr:inorganic diphosphatase [Butyrivibrio sp.]